MFGYESGHAVLCHGSTVRVNQNENFACMFYTILYFSFHTEKTELETNNAA